MNLIVPFLFREQECSALVFIDTSEQPYFIFADLLTKELINEFGEELSIKTDGERVLHMKHNYKSIDALRAALFASVKNIIGFKIATKVLLQPIA